jgi:general secretion pathway protein C
MRLAMDPRAQRLLRRVPRTNGYTVLELLLLALLAVQCARLFWALVTPVGPVGDWKAATAPTTPSTALLGSFDPFFRLNAQAGPVTVTALNLRLFGVRQDQASGRGSAIIQTADGQQRSYAVGEEIMPGVMLSAVEFDSVTLSRGGATEQLFMDQSPTADVAAPGAPSPAPMSMVTTPAPAVAVPVGADPAADIAFTPRMNGSRVTGIVVQPRGSGNAFRAAGLAPGDVITSVNGRAVGSAEQARSIASELGGGSAVIQVERNGRMLILRAGPGR